MHHDGPDSAPRGAAPPGAASSDTAASDPARAVDPARTTPLDTDGPVDPDVEAGSSAGRRWYAHHETATLGVIAAGGGVGALARYQAGVWWPTTIGRLPWTTLGINAVGCALIGVLLVLVTEVHHPHRLLRPALGTGVLGGFTTFSTYAVDISTLIAGRHPALALGHLLLTVAVALAAVTAATRLTRRLTRRGVADLADAAGATS